MANKVTFVDPPADEKRGNSFPQGTIVRVKRYAEPIGLLMVSSPAAYSTIERPAIVANGGGTTAVVYLDTGSYDQAALVLCTKAGPIRIE